MSRLYQKQFIPKHREIGEVLLVPCWGSCVPLSGTKVVLISLGNEAAKVHGAQPGGWAASSWV